MSDEVSILSYEGSTELATDYKCRGSIVLKQYPTSAFKEVCSFGFTGETYYDFDKGFDADHPIVIIHFNGEMDPI